MKKRRYQSAGLLLLLLSFLLQWENTQLLAWAGMITDYSRDRSIAQAVEDTFSGEQPCPLCTKLTEAKTGSAQDPAFQSSSVQLGDLCIPADLSFPSLPISPACFLPENTLPPCAEKTSPPRPPPRYFSC